MATLPSTKSTGDLLTSTDMNNLVASLRLRGFASRVVDASGDGTDTTIADAITNIAGTGGLILVKAGTFTVTSSIVVSKPVVIIGEGRATSVETSTGLSNNGVFQVTSADVRISNLQVKITSNPSSSTHGIRVDADNVAIDNCSIVGGSFANATHGIVWGLATATGGQASFNEVDGFNLGGITVGVGSAFAQSKILIVNNNSHDNATGIKIEAVTSASAIIDDIIIKGNFCHTNSADGILIKGTSTSTLDDVVVMGNRCVGNTGSGIDVEDANATATIVVGNTLKGNTGANLEDTGTDTQAAHNITA